MTQEGTHITIPALGRPALLGYLYDERTDQFRNYNVFKGPITDNAITLTQNSKTSLKMSLIDSNRDKFRLYDIKASIQANLLSGILKVSGSAAYLQEDKKSSREVTGLMLCECCSAVEDLQLYFENLRDQYNTEVINQTGATHIVTQIKWGGNVAIEFSKKVNEEKDEHKIKGNLEIVFEKAKGVFSVKGSGDVNLNFSDQDKLTQFSLDVKGDIQLPDQTPITPEEVEQLIKQVPRLIQKINGGKGVPLEFTLTPLSKLRSHLKQPSRKDEFAMQLDESILNDFINIFETISETSKNLNDYLSDFRKNSICVLPKVLAEMGKIQVKFTSSKLTFQSQMKEAIIAVRSGTKAQESLIQLGEIYNAGEYSPANVQIKLQDFDKAIKKIEFYKTICKSYPNVEYFGYKSNLEMALLSNLKNVIYALFLFPKSQENDSQNYQENEHLFFHKLNHTFNKVFVVDCEFEFTRSPTVKRTVIKQFVNNQVNIEDVNEVVKRQSQKKEETLPLEMKAIGRFVEMGQLYNARTDTFLKDSFLKQDLPEEIIHVKNKFPGHCEIFDVSSENLKDKFKSLKVEPELQYSVLADIIPLERSGRYLAAEIGKCQNLNGNEGEYCPAQVQSFVHSRRIRDESISVNDSLLKYFAPDALSKGATHFVTKIEYGCVSIFSCQLHEGRGGRNIRNFCKNPSVEMENHLKFYAKQLKRIVKKIQIPSADSGNNDNINYKILESDLKILEGKGNECGIKLTIYSDIQGEGSPPETIDNMEDLLAFFNNELIPKQIKENGGKGMPISYVLFPLSNLGNKVGILSPCIPYGLVSKHFPNPNELIGIFEDILLARNQVQNMSLLLKENMDCVTDEDLFTFQNIQKEFRETLGKFQEEVKNLILRIKSGEKHFEQEKEVNKLQHLLAEYKNLNIKLFDKKQPRRYVKLEAMDIVKEKIQIWKKIQNGNNDDDNDNMATVCSIGRPMFKNQHLFNQLFSDKHFLASQSYFLFYHPSWVREHGDLWRQNCATFLNLGKEGENNKNKKLYLVHCEFEHEFCKSVKEPRIHEYTNGILTSSDFITEQKEIAESSEKESCLKSHVCELEDRLETKILSVERILEDNVTTIESLASEITNLKEEHENKINDLELQIDESWRKLGKVEWVWGGKGKAIPKNAIVADEKAINNVVYVARGYWDGRLIPGKLDPCDKLCYFSWIGEVHGVAEYEVLVAPPGVMEWKHDSKIGANDVVVIGGKTRNGTKLAIGRCNYKGSTIPGNIHQNHKACYIPFKGKEIESKCFDILCYKNYVHTQLAELDQARNFFSFL